MFLSAGNLDHTNVCEIDDLFAAQSGKDRRLPATVENMRQSLATYGLIVMRNAFDSAEIAELIENARAQSGRIESAIRSGVELESNFGVKSGGLAYDIVTIDPNTANRNSKDFTETSLYTTLMKTALFPILVEAVGRDGCWTGAKARTVIPGIEKGRNGQLGLHIEKRAFPYEGIHNIWTPLVPPGVVTNFDVPGIQFYIGRLDFFESLSPGTEKKILKFLHDLGNDVHSPNPRRGKHGFLYRPRLSGGDLCMFTGFVPHAGCLPENAASMRVGFDVRIFPKCEGNRVASLKLGELGV